MVERPTGKALRFDGCSFLSGGKLPALPGKADFTRAFRTRMFPMHAR